MTATHQPGEAPRHAATQKEYQMSVSTVIEAFVTFAGAMLTALAFIVLGILAFAVMGDPVATEAVRIVAEPVITALYNAIN